MYDVIALPSVKRKLIVDKGVFGPIAIALTKELDTIYASVDDLLCAWNIISGDIEDLLEGEPKSEVLGQAELSFCVILNNYNGVFGEEDIDLIIDDYRANNIHLSFTDKSVWIPTNFTGSAFTVA